MSLGPVVQAGISGLLQIPFVKELSGPLSKKAVSIIEQHFLFDAKSIATAFQESFGYAMAAVGSGLALESSSSSGFVSWFASILKQMTKEQISKEFSNNLKAHYLAPFCEQQGLSEDVFQTFCYEGASTCKRLSKQNKKLLPLDAFPDMAIASMMREETSMEVSSLLCERIKEGHPETPPMLLQFFEAKGLLGAALLHFFREKLRRDERVNKTLNALRQEGLWTDIKQLQGAVGELKEGLENQLHHLEQHMASVEEQIREASFEERRLLRQQRADLETTLIKVEQQLSSDLEVVLHQAKETWTEQSAKLDLFERNMGSFCDLVSSRFDEVLANLENKLEPIQTGIDEVQTKLDRVLKMLSAGVSLSPDAQDELRSGLNPHLTLADRFTYDKQRPIGQGAVGYVYRAHKKGTGELRAIKVLNPVAAQDEQVVTRFLRESMLLYQLKHAENIVRIYGSGGGKDLEFFMEMELIEGATLKQHMEKHLPFHQILALGKQLCQALKVCHDAGIVHRDVNPNNVMITSEGVLKLMDFGVAKIIGLDGLTMQGQQIGQGLYMSPEQHEGRSHLAGKPSDVYSIGAILYHMSAGKRPPRTQEVEPIRARNPKVPTWFDGLILECLATTPAERPANAGALLTRLNNQGLSAQEEQLKQAIQRTIEAGHGILTKKDRTHLLHMAEALGVPQAKALALLKELQGDGDPKALFRSWVEEEHERVGSISNDAEWGLFYRGVRLGLEQQSIRQILDDYVSQPSVKEEPAPWNDKETEATEEAEETKQAQVDKQANDASAAPASEAAPEVPEAISLVLWQEYLRKEIAPCFGLPFKKSIWNQGFVVQEKEVFLLVTLEKQHMQELHQYDDAFLSPRLFQWQSQNRTTQSSKHGQIIQHHESKGYNVHLFVRKTKKIGSHTAPFTYCGRLSFESWENEKPITVYWKLQDELPKRLQEHFGIQQAAPSPAKIEEKYAAWLDELQSTRMSKSYKMVLVLAMLSRGEEHWHMPLTLEEAAPFFHQYLMSDPIRKQVDFSASKHQKLWVYDETKMAKEIVQQPMSFWAGSSEQVAFSQGRFSLTFSIDDEDLSALYQQTLRLCEERLAAYFEKKSQR